MRITLDKGMLQRRLKVCDRVVPRKGGLPFHHGIYILTDVDGVVQIWARNAKEGYSSTLQAIGEWEDGTTAVAAQELIRAVNAAPGDEVTIISDEAGGGARIESGTARWNVAALAGVLDPEALADGEDYDPPNEDGAVSLDQAEMRRVLEAVRYSASKSESRPSFMQVQLGDGHALAADGRRVHFETVEGLDWTGTLDIPERSLDTLLEALGAEGVPGVVWFRQTEGGTLQFWFGTMLYEVGRLNYPFPDIESIVFERARRQAGAVTLAAADLVTAIKVAAVSIEDGGSIKLRFTNGVIEVIGEGQRGDGRMEVRCSSSVQSGTELSVRADDLLDALGHLDTEEDGDIRFTVNDSGDGDPGWVYIVSGGGAAAIRPVAS